MPQKHSTIKDGKRLIWFTERLWKLAEDLESFEIKTEDIKELDMDCWFGEDSTPTLRKIAKHCEQINNASLEYPIILNADGSLMDGGHRLCKSLLLGHKTIHAVKFLEMPTPDNIIELDV